MISNRNACLRRNALIGITLILSVSLMVLAKTGETTTSTQQQRSTTNLGQNEVSRPKMAVRASGSATPNVAILTSRGFLDISTENMTRMSELVMRSRMKREHESTMAYTESCYNYPPIKWCVFYEDRELRTMEGFDSPYDGYDLEDTLKKVLNYVSNSIEFPTVSRTIDIFVGRSPFSLNFIAQGGSPVDTTYTSGFMPSAFQHRMEYGTPLFYNHADITLTVSRAVDFHFAGDPIYRCATHDLFSVLVHEMIHGMGVLSVTKNNGQNNFDGVISTARMEYEWNIFNSLSVTRIFDADGRFVDVMSNLYTPGAYYVLGEDGFNSYIYTPYPFSQGTSLAHLHPGEYPSSLMRPMFDQYEMTREFDSRVIAMLNKMGYVKYKKGSMPSGVMRYALVDNIDVKGCPAYDPATISSDGSAVQVISVALLVVVAMVQLMVIAF